MASGSQNLPMFKVNLVEGPCFLLPGKTSTRVGVTKMGLTQNQKEPAAARTTRGAHGRCGERWKLLCSKGQLSICDAVPHNPPTVFQHHPAPSRVLNSEPASGKCTLARAEPHAQAPVPDLLWRNSGMGQCLQCACPRPGFVSRPHPPALPRDAAAGCLGLMETGSSCVAQVDLLGSTDPLAWDHRAAQSQTPVTLCVYVCVCVLKYAWAHVCAHMWKPEDNP